jgi:hypothetical protein
MAAGFKQGIKHGIEQMSSGMTRLESHADERHPSQNTESPRNGAAERRDQGNLAPAIDVPELPNPQLGIDGWSFEGTELAGRLPVDVDAECATLLHNVHCGQATVWTYDRLSDLFAKNGAPEHALAVLENYFAAAALTGAEPDKALTRRRQHLTNRLIKATKPRRSGTQAVVRLQVAKPQRDIESAGIEAEDTATSA